MTDCSRVLPAVLSLGKAIRPGKNVSAGLITQTDQLQFLTQAEPS